MAPSILNVARSIREAWDGCEYDHHPSLPNFPGREKWAGENFRKQYACFKHSVAAVLKPRKIVEIGVGLGVAARAFLSAFPLAEYHGYDDFSMFPGSFEAVDASLRGRNHELHRHESSRLEPPARWLDAWPQGPHTVPACDLFHVDGSHLLGHQTHDVAVALRTGTWVLVDDCHDSQVVAAVGLALFGWRQGNVEWYYFPETWAGDILIYCGG